MTTKRILNRADVLARVGFGKTTLYGLVRQGEFPRPVQTSVNRVGWLEAEVDSWIASRERAGSWSQYGIPTSMPACAGIESSAFLCDRRPAPYVVNGTNYCGKHARRAQEASAA